MAEHHSARAEGEIERAVLEEAKQHRAVARLPGYEQATVVEAGDRVRVRVPAADRQVGDPARAERRIEHPAPLEPDELDDAATAALGPPCGDDAAVGPHRKCGCRRRFARGICDERGIERSIRPIAGEPSKPREDDDAPVGKTDDTVGPRCWHRGGTRPVCPDPDERVDREVVHIAVVDHHCNGAVGECGDDRLVAPRREGAEIQGGLRSVLGVSVEHERHSRARLELAGGDDRPVRQHGDAGRRRVGLADDHPIRPERCVRRSVGQEACDERAVLGVLVRGYRDRDRARDEDAALTVEGRRQHLSGRIAV